MPPLIESWLFPLPLGQAVLFYQNWRMSLSEAQRPLTITIILVLLLVLISLVVRRNRPGRGKTSIAFTIEEPREIHDVLRKTIQERSTYELQFLGDGAQRMRFFCAPLEIEPGTGITLEASGFIKPGSAWVGRPVTCYFKIPGERAEIKWSFFHFTSTITKIVAREAIQHIVLDLPHQLERKQRRAHLRLDPPRGDIPELRIWPETLSNLDRPEDDPPMLDFLDTRQDNQLQVVNISASGLLLDIRPPLPEVLKTELEKGKRFYISLILRNPGQTSTQTFQLLTQVRNVFIDPDQGQRLVGLSFAAHLTRRGDSNHWQALDGKGVEEIEDWVFKRHLQIYREKGLI